MLFIGQNRLILILFFNCKSNGDVYDGEWINDQKSGYGKFIFANGNQYTGEFLNSKKHGKGVFIFGIKFWGFNFFFKAEKLIFL